LNIFLLPFKQKNISIMTKYSGLLKTHEEKALFTRCSHLIQVPS